METVVQSAWTKSKLLVKTGIIAFILLLLQIPTYYVEQLIAEREGRQKDAIAEVSSKWAGRQNIIWPMLIIPYVKKSTDSSSQTKLEKHLAYFLPDELTVNASVTPVEKYRGIYKVALYSSQINMSGRFESLHPERLGLAPEDLLWNEAQVRMSISDSKGLNDEVKLKFNDSTLSLMPDDAGANGELATHIPLTAETAKSLSFSSSLNLNGSEQLLFTPVGKSTTVNLSSAWPHPSFTGDILPMQKKISKDGFEAKWKSMIEQLNDPDKILWTHDHILPNFLNIAVGELVED